MSNRVCRWGILSAANIARKNWQGLRNSNNSVVTAVAARDVAKAQSFIDECSAHIGFETKPAAVGSYEELLKRDDVDAIYLPVPTGLRKEWVIRAAQAGKHVLAEKPVGCDVAEAEEMIAACKQHNVQFMDGVMFMHSLRLEKLREVLDDKNSLGSVRRITSSFCFMGNDEFTKTNIRANGELEPLGCVGDLGWYNARFSLWVMNYQMPRSVSGRQLADAHAPGSRQPVPAEFSGELFFDGGVTASFFCSFNASNQQWANISGTNGYIEVRDFVIPYYANEIGFTVTNPVLNKKCCDFNFEDHTRRVAVAEYSASYENSQEANMFRNFSQLVLSQKRDWKWAEIALKTQKILDACLASARENGKRIDVV